MNRDEVIRKDFEDFCRKELGDVPVLDGGRYISQKISNYWRLWNEATQQEADRAAKILEDAANRLEGDRKRVPQVDAHVACVLRDKAADIRKGEA